MQAQRTQVTRICILYAYTHTHACICSLFSQHFGETSAINCKMALCLRKSGSFQHWDDRVYLIRLSFSRLNDIADLCDRYDFGCDFERLAQCCRDSRLTTDADHLCNDQGWVPLDPDLILDRRSDFEAAVAAAATVSCKHSLSLPPTLLLCLLQLPPSRPHSFFFSPSRPHKLL